MEQAVANSRQGVVVQLGCGARCQHLSVKEKTQNFRKCYTGPRTLMNTVMELRVP